MSTEKTCVAMTCYRRWWFPSLRRVIDKPSNVSVEGGLWTVALRPVD